MELLILIGGVALLILFRKMLKANAIGAEQRARLWAETMSMDVQVQREEHVKEYLENMKEIQGVDDVKNIKTTSSEDVFKMLKIEL